MGIQIQQRGREARALRSELTALKSQFSQALELTDRLAAMESDFAKAMENRDESNVFSGVPDLKDEMRKYREEAAEVDRGMQGLYHMFAMYTAQVQKIVDPEAHKKQTARTRQELCIANLKQIDGAKEQWAIDHNKAPKTVPKPDDLFGPDLYIRGTPACPAQGSYSINPIDTLPTCSIEGHKLTQ